MAGQVVGYLLLEAHVKLKFAGLQIALALPTNRKDFGEDLDNQVESALFRV